MLATTIKPPCYEPGNLSENSHTGSASSVFSLQCQTGNKQKQTLLGLIIIYTCIGLQKCSTSFTLMVMGFEYFLHDATAPCFKVSTVVLLRKVDVLLKIWIKSKKRKQQ